MSNSFVLKQPNKFGSDSPTSNPRRVHFYVQQRNSSFDITRLNRIPFAFAVVKGNTMNLISGIFTAPRRNLFLFFHWNGASRIVESFLRLYFSLVLNGKLIGTSFVQEDSSANNKFSLRWPSSHRRYKHEKRHAQVPMGTDWIFILVHPRGCMTTEA